MRTTVFHRMAAVLAGVLLMGGTAVSAAPPVDELRALLDAQRADEAYRLGLKHPDQLGHPAFDLMFGIAAVNAGRASEGVLALERYLLRQPGDRAARLELARGYYLLRDNGRAREEFEALLRLEPPQDVRRVIEDYLEALRSRERQTRTAVQFSAEFGGGYDSNPLSGVKDPNISLPVFGDITLTDAAVAKRDRFGDAVLDGRVSVPVNARLGWFVQASGDWRGYRELKTYDQSTLSAAIGLNAAWGENLLRATFGFTGMRLDNARYRDTPSIGIDLLLPAASGGFWYGNAQAARFRYAGANAVRDADYAALAAGRRVQTASRQEWDAVLTLAREENVEADRKSLSRDMAGGKLGWRVPLAPAWSAALGVSVLKSRYRAPDPLLEVRRSDTYAAFDLSLTWQLTQAWSLRSDFQAARNRSNLALHDYERQLAILKARYEYR